MNGKISIPKTSTPRYKSLEAKNNKPSLKLIIEKPTMKDKRSASSLTSTLKINKAKSKTKIKLDTTNE